MTPARYVGLINLPCFVELKMLSTENVVAKAKRNLPWWLESGTEICPACSHTYVYETEYRCVACDGPLCPICVEYTTALEIYCPTTDCAHAQIED
jgi:hypothetical protein